MSRVTLLKQTVLTTLLACLSSLTAMAATQAAEISQYYQPGFVAKHYAEAWSPELDVATLKPAHVQTLTEVRKHNAFDSKAPEKGFTAIEGYLEVEQPIDAWFKPGYGRSTHAAMYVNGKKVYEKAPGAEAPTTQNIRLSTGLHPYRIVYFQPMDRLLCFTNMGRRLGLKHSRIRLDFTKTLEQKLTQALVDLTAQAAGSKEISQAEIDTYNDVLAEYKYAFGNSETIVDAALKFVETHDAHHPPLFTEESTEWGRDGREGLRWAVFQTMQYLLNYAYTPENLKIYPQRLGQAKFATADKFPGPVEKPDDPSKEYTVPVWATFPDTAPWDFWMGPRTARKPTGAYLAPGTVATVEVPEKLVDKGFSIRVGAHANNLVRKRKVDRLWNISLLYPINATKVKIANPVGGGIYIEVPEGRHEGRSEITFTNIVRAPFYANTRVRQTSLEDWQEVERHHPAPWVDFQSETFMMQLPRVWVYNLEDPATVMARWDKAVEAVVKVMGYNMADVGREAFYIQPDTQLRNSVFSPGHPQVNVGGADPERDQYEGLNGGTFHLKGPEYAPDWVFHEWGHALALAGPAGENETSLNFLHVTANNWGLGQPMDEAFRNSRGGGREGVTLDNAAVNWMTALNFDGYVQQKSQKSYQFIGHAKYVDVARLFGWETIRELYQSINRDRIAHRESDGERGEHWGKHIDFDRYIKRFSKTSGVDMRPLFHLWGTPPTCGLVLASDRERVERQIADAKREREANRPDAPHGEKLAQVGIDEANFDLKRYRKLLDRIEDESEKAQRLNAEYESMMQSGEIRRSAVIYDQLVHYKSIVPEDNEAFREFALSWYGWNNEPPKKRPLWTENDHRKQWYRYDTATAADIRSLMDDLIAFYFPEGRPEA